jgi:tRNA wybutosine-synthesizing protein 3
MQSRFEVKKKRILEQIDVPDDAYTDLSPKGCIDEPIRPLIQDINRLDGLVTTSSCSGRISVFLEGRKKNTLDVAGDEDGDSTRTGPGGKGGGGSWLFVSHYPVEIPVVEPELDLTKLFGLETQAVMGVVPSPENSFIHLKFEPMILHILCSSLANANRVLTAAMSSGFRESGALSLTTSKTGETNPMVAVRSTGYSFDAIIGYKDDSNCKVPLVDENYLRTLVGIANERFKTNEERIQRFRTSLMEQSNQDMASKSSTSLSNTSKSDWEDPEARKQRKRQEGLLRQQALANQATTSTSAENVSNDVQLDALYE